MPDKYVCTVKYTYEDETTQVKISVGLTDKITNRMGLVFAAMYGVCQCTGARVWTEVLVLKTTRRTMKQL